MTEIRDLSSGTAVGDGVFQSHCQYGLYATVAYSEGDVILTESPLVASSSSDDDDVRRQFSASSLVAAAPPPAADADDCERNGDSKSSSDLMHDLLLPKGLIGKAAVLWGKAAHARTGKLRGMLVALASYAARPPPEDIRDKLFGLYRPPTKEGKKAEEAARELAGFALQCADHMAAKGGALRALLRKTGGGREALRRLLLTYACNAFEGGRIYPRLSRINHSCDPNAVVVAGGGAGGADVSVLKAACAIAPGDEITISYLGKYLYAGYPIRQRLLREDKYFVCLCVRCRGGDASEKGVRGDGFDPRTTEGSDLASRVPCPLCHPRNGRYLDDDVMFDEGAGEDDGFTVSYAVPSNGETPEERTLHCPRCDDATAAASNSSSVRKRKEGMAIKYMCIAEEKVWERLTSSDSGGQRQQRKPQTPSDDDTETEQELDQQFLQMATSVCGARHWTTHFLNLSLIEESLASLNSVLVSGEGPEPSSHFVEIAEVADGIEQSYAFAASLKLRLDPAHWLFDYTVGLARTLVGLGDTKSTKYGAEWISKVERYARHFEDEGMNRVVVAIRDTWQRGTAGKTGACSEHPHHGGKRRKVEP